MIEYNYSEQFCPADRLCWYVKPKLLLRKTQTHYTAENSAL